MTRTQSKQRFQIEALEARVLLSADGLSAVADTSQGSDIYEVREEQVLEEELSAVQSQLDPVAESGFSDSLSGDLTEVATEALDFDCDEHDVDEFDSANDADEETAPVVEENETSSHSYSVEENFPASSDAQAQSNDDGLIATSTDNSISRPNTGIMVTTLMAGNGPPADASENASFSPYTFDFGLLDEESQTELLAYILSNSVSGICHDGFLVSQADAVAIERDQELSEFQRVLRINTNQGIPDSGMLERLRLSEQIMLDHTFTVGPIEIDRPEFEVVELEDSALAYEVGAPFETGVKFTRTSDEFPFSFWGLNLTSGIELGVSSTIFGSGSTQGDIVQYGVTSPGNSPGKIDHAGDFAQLGTLIIEVGGTTAGPGTGNVDDGYDQLNVSGQLTLDGEIQIKLLNGFTVSEGDTFDILTFGSLSGKFATGTGLFGFGDGSLYFDLIEKSDRIQLVAKALPGGGLASFGMKFVIDAHRDAAGRFLSSYFTDGPVTLDGTLDLKKKVELSGAMTLFRSGGNVEIGMVDATALIGTGLGSANEKGFKLTGLNGGLVVNTNGFAGSLTGSLSVVGIDGVTVSGSNIKLVGNTTGSAVSATVDNPSGGTFDIDYADGTELLHFSGSVDVSVKDFFRVKGDFTFSSGETTTATLADGSTKEVSVVMMAAVGAELFAGVHGDADDPAALGLRMTGIDFAFLGFAPTDISDTTSYHALRASAASAELLGGTGVTVSVTDLTARANSSSVGAVINLAAGDLDGDGDEDGKTSVTVGSSVIDFAFDEALIEVIATVTVEVAGFVHFNGDIAVRRGATTNAILSDGSSKQVSMLTIGGTGLDLFVGVNGRGADELGFSLTNVSVALALVKPTDEADTNVYYALVANADNATLSGSSDIELTADAISIRVNSSSEPVRVIDFTKGDLDGNPDTAGGTQVSQGGSDSAFLSFSERIVDVVGNMVLRIQDFAFINGAMAVRSGGSRTVTLSDGSTKETEALFIGADSVNVFAGINGPGDQDDAVGVSLEEVGFAAAIFDAKTDASQYFALKVDATSGLRH